MELSEQVYLSRRQADRIKAAVLRLEGMAMGLGGRRGVSLPSVRVAVAARITSGPGPGGGFSWVEVDPKSGRDVSNGLSGTASGSGGDGEAYVLGAAAAGVNDVVMLVRTAVKDERVSAGPTGSTVYRTVMMAAPSSVPGVIVCSGPNGEADFPNDQPMYWVQRAKDASGASGSGSGGATCGQMQPEADPDGSVWCATNWGELNAARMPGYSRLLTPGTPVQVFFMAGADGSSRAYLIAGDEYPSGKTCGSSASSSSGSSSSSSSASSSSSSSSSGSGSGSGGSGGGGGGGSSKNSAIVPSRLSATGYTALYVTESPEVRFEEYISVRVQGKINRVVMDERFVEVVEPGTIRAASVTPSRAISGGMIGARVEGSTVVVELPRGVRVTSRGGRPLDVTVHLTAIRRGFAGTRFGDRTAEQFAANERFIRAAYGERGEAS